MILTMTSRCLIVSAWLLVASMGGVSRANEGAHALGKTCGEFTLDNCYGKSVSLSDFADSQAIALVFLGAECPMAKLYGPRLSQLQATFADRGVTVIGINSNTQDSLTELAAYVRQHQIDFPMLKDVGNRVADELGATRTPEVFLLDRERVVRYHGRIDDQYGVGVSRGTTTHPDLAVAIEQLIEGKPITTPETEITGCHIGRVQRTTASGDITYAKHIAPIFNSRCMSCHRENEIAPFTLTCYDDVLGWEDTILEVIDSNRMPPWFANPEHGKFANDARLSEDEKELIRTWVDHGMPPGDVADLPDPPTFTDGWMIPEPDQVIAMRDQPFEVPAEGVIDYQRFVVDPQWTEDKYIYAAQARPQNRSVVHHILVYIIPPGGRRPDLRQVLVGYAPGGLPILLDDGIAIHVAAGSKLLFEMHYTPNGHAQTDLSDAGVCFIDKDKVTRRLEGQIAINPKFKIPPGKSDHDVVATYTATTDQLLLAMTPHMHLRGKAFRYDARYPDGTSEVLLDVPHYDFNWQLKYVLDKPKRLPRGTMVECTAIFDNSANNPSNPDPSKTVRWGDQSFDEMMIGFMDTIAAD